MPDRTALRIAVPVCDGNAFILPFFRPGSFRPLRKTRDIGARTLLSVFGLRLVPSNDTASVTDIDTWEAYRSLPDAWDDILSRRFRRPTRSSRRSLSSSFIEDQHVPTLHSF